MPRGYRYVKFGKKYLCLQQSPLGLLRFLRLKNRGLRPFSGAEWKGKPLARLKAMGRFFFLRRGTSRKVLELPVFGHVCLPVHRGYKLFDLQRNTVVKLFGQDVEPDRVSQEIENVRAANGLDFAPQVTRWNVEERWYEEDLINGDLGFLSVEEGDFPATYQRELAPLLEQLVTLSEPQPVKLSAYVAKLTEGVGATLKVLQKTIDSEPGSDGETIDTIQRFMDAVSERLSAEEDFEVPLVFSHGDFSLVNALRTEGGLILIDWEGACHRSALFDLYQCFLTELYYGRATSDVVSQVNEAIACLSNGLQSKQPAVAESMQSHGSAYRWLHYVERLHDLCEREINRKLFGILMRTFRAFEDYEERVRKVDAVCN